MSSDHGTGDLGDLSMTELFRIEVEHQTAALTEGLLALERGDAEAAHLDALMRAAHALKGAARIMELELPVRITHAMEDWFVAAQKGEVRVTPERIDVLLRGGDLLRRLAEAPDADHVADVERFLSALRAADGATPPGDAAVRTGGAGARPSAAPTERRAGSDRVVRVMAESMDRLLGFAAESLVSSRWLGEFLQGTETLRHLQRDTATALARVRERLGPAQSREGGREHWLALERQYAELRRHLASELAKLEDFHARASTLSTRLYQEVLQSRMRPFQDVAQRFPRMARDLARELGKEAVLEIDGARTPVDRDVLERLEPVLIHLVRNAVDHGLELPDERRRVGKPSSGTVWLRASHRAGMVLVTVEDDGRGVDPERLRELVVARQYVQAEAAAQMSDGELLEFLYLPGFSLRETVTEISGRGVGLDLVQNTVREIGGKLGITSRPGAGLRFELQVPLTLSVLRAVLVEVAHEPYAVPMARVERIIKVRREEIGSVEGHPFVDVDGHHVGLVNARQVFGTPSTGDALPEEISVLVLGQDAGRAGVMVDRLLGERELVVRPLDSRLGKVRNISAAALMPDLAPVLIVDVDDVLRSIEHLVAGRAVAGIAAIAEQPAAPRKRVLIVEDSFTVRELERKLLANRGYAVDVALDGMDGWNAVRATSYDLVVSDVDMPRMDGIELVTRIRADRRLQGIPIIIVSYKDRDEDRLRGLDAGADRYLPKGNFQGDALVEAVMDLIGGPEGR